MNNDEEAKETVKQIATEGEKKEKTERKKPFYKKWWFWCIIIALILGIAIYAHNNHNTTFNNYKKQSISILNQYKNGELTRKETSEKIDALSEKLGNEYEINNESYILCLDVKLSLIAYKLTDAELSDTEVNNYIQEIKDINQ